MLFNSLHFLFFFPLVTALYYLLPRRFSQWILLLASAYFYMAFYPPYILILFLLILIDYTAGILMEGASSERRKKNWLLLSLTSNIALLGFFKYYNFFLDNVEAVLGWMGVHSSIPHLNILLPIGLSFHTFQSMSYTIEVYRGNQVAERDLKLYSLYVLFFPQLVAGPIERPQNLLHQLKRAPKFSWSEAVAGLERVLLGLFKKVFIADRLAIIVNNVYAKPHDYRGPSLVLASIFFAFQIYADFSGYSDIALGSARVLGVQLMENFNAPYFSKSTAEFWMRWHISLSTWLKDYLFIPLVANWRKLFRYSAPLALFITFSISGLWHGASWNYVIFGMLHGFYLVFSYFTLDARTKFLALLGLKGSPLHRLFQVGTTFSLVCFAWIFFRAQSFSDAIYIISHLGSGWGAEFSMVHSFSAFFSGLVGDWDLLEWELAASGLLLVVFIQFRETRHSFRYGMGVLGGLLQWTVYYLLFFALLFFGQYHAPQKFIYFQF